MHREQTETAARLLFQQLETNARKTYSQTIGQLDQSAASGPAVRAANAAVQAAGFQMDLDAAYADAEEAYWGLETGIATAKDVVNAQTDIDLWTAEEPANVAAVQAIDSALTSFYGHELPWSDYLVAQAQAHQAWWGVIGQPGAAATDYLQWLINRRTPPDTWQTNVNAAHATQSLTERTARHDEAVNVANASRDQAVALAAAAYSELVGSSSGPLMQPGLLTAAKTYADNLAAAEAAKADKRAEATRDYAVDQDSTSYTDRNEEADSEYDDNRASYEQSYGSSAASGVVTELKAEADAQSSYPDTVALWTKNCAEADAGALYVYESSDSGEYAALTAALALLDKNYALAESSSLASMAASLATASETASPWASYYAAQVSAYDDWTQVTAPAQETQRKNASLAQAGHYDEVTRTGSGEIALQAAERDLSLASAAADYAQATSLDAVYHDVAYAQADFVAFSGETQPSYPALEDTDPFGDFTIQPAPTDDYNANFTPAATTFSYFFLFFPTAALTDIASIPTHVEVDWPADFWDLAGDATAIESEDDVESEMVGGTGDVSLVPAHGDENDPLESVSPVAVLEASDSGTAEWSLNDSVSAILGLGDQIVGEFWSRYGQILHVQLSDRPDFGPPPAAPSDTARDAERNTAGIATSPAEKKAGIVASINDTAADIATKIATAIADGGNHIQGEFEKFAAEREASAARNAANAELKARQQELAEKFQKLFDQKITFLGFTTSAGAFGTGVHEGFVQGAKDGVLGMAVGAARFSAKAASFLFQLDPRVRDLSKKLTGQDIGADEEAQLRKFAADAEAAAKRAPETLTRLAQLKFEIDQFMQRDSGPFFTALVSGDIDGFDKSIEGLSPIAQEPLRTARTLTVELAHELIDHVDARTFGNIVGQVLYECVEDAVIGAVVAGATAATAGAATPAAGAAFAIKAAKLARIAHRLEVKFGASAPLVAKALSKFQEVVVWMAKFPICFVAGTPVHTSTGLKNIEDIRVGDLVLARNENSPSNPPDYRRVLGTVTTHPSRLYHVRLVTERTKEFETLIGTGEHPFYVVDRREFVPAKELAQGDRLSLSDGRTALVAEVGIEDAAPGTTFTTYNFEVADDHTYFVGKAGVWVHNAGNPCDEALEIFLNAKRLGKDDAGALVDARNYIGRLNGIGNVEKSKHLDDLDKLLGKPPGMGTPVVATVADYLNPAPNTVYFSNGYFYKTDGQGRLAQAAGNLRLSAAERNKYRQGLVGESSGVPGDEGGHLIGAQFDGLAAR